MVRTFPQFPCHFCLFYNASVLTERLRFAILRTVQMSGDHRHQRPLTSLEKQDSWLSGLLYHVIFFSDLYILAFVDRCLTFCPKVYFDKQLRIEQGEILWRYFSEGKIVS